MYCVVQNAVIEMFNYLNSLKTRKEAIPLRHKKMSDEARQNFIARYKESENEHPFFRWMKQSHFTMMMWVGIVMLYGVWAIWYANRVYFRKHPYFHVGLYVSYLKMIVCFIAGVLNLQI